MIASQPQLAIAGHGPGDLGQHASCRTAQAVALGYAFVGLGTNQDVDRRGPAALRIGKRVEWQLR